MTKEFFTSDDISTSLGITLFSQLCSMTRSISDINAFTDSTFSDLGLRAYLNDESTEKK